MGFFENWLPVLVRPETILYQEWTAFFHGFSRIDDDFYEELEEVLIMGDLGVQATYDILDDLKAKSKKNTSKNQWNAGNF